MTRKSISVLWAVSSMFLILSAPSSAAQPEVAAPTVSWEMIAAAGVNAMASCGPCSSCFIPGDACDFYAGLKGKCVASDSACKTGGGVMCYCKGPSSDVPPDPGARANTCAAR